ncbi:MAG: hypothetical protein JWP81_2259 [Ferruginibacter sp.]|nr:hypothetical protein [Ferruginibacter sp.]
MKKISMAIGFLLACSTFCVAQCEKSLVIHSSKTEYLGADSLLQNMVPENTVIEINHPNIVIRPGGKKMEGVIHSDSCSWSIPYKEGKSILNTTFKDDQGNSKNAVITINAKGEN